MTAQTQEELLAAHLEQQKIDVITHLHFSLSIYIISIHLCNKNGFFNYLYGLLLLLFFGLDNHLEHWKWFSYSCYVLLTRSLLLGRFCGSMIMKWKPLRLFVFIFFLVYFSGNFVFCLSIESGQ